MGAAILSGVLDYFTETRAAGEEPRFSHFVATCQSVGSAVGLRQRFASHGDIVDVIRGDNIKAMNAGDAILLAFKPYMIDLVLKNGGVREALAGKLVLSVLAGSPSEKIEKAIHAPGPSTRDEKPFYIKRAMMNLAAEFQESMTVIETTSIQYEYEELSDWIFLQFGRITSIAPDLYDVGGVLAGASGALLSVAIEGMLDGVVCQGLKRADAKKILVRSLYSLAKLLEGEHPAVLREKFSSPKGTTIAGLLSLEKDRARYASIQPCSEREFREKQSDREVESDTQDKRAGLGLEIEIEHRIECVHLLHICLLDSTATTFKRYAL